MSPITSITWLMTLVILALAAACQQMGVEPVARAPKTVQESLYIASESGKGMTQTLMQLRAQGLVPKDQYDKAINSLQNARNLTQQGLNLYRSGDYSGAATSLDKVDMVLHLVAAILAEIEVNEGAQP